MNDSKVIRNVNRVRSRSGRSFVSDAPKTTAFSEQRGADPKRSAPHSRRPTHRKSQAGLLGARTGADLCRNTGLPAPHRGQQARTPAELPSGSWPGAGSCAASNRQTVEIGPAVHVPGVAAARNHRNLEPRGNTATFQGCLGALHNRLTPRGSWPASGGGLPRGAGGPRARADRDREAPRPRGPPRARDPPPARGLPARRARRSRPRSPRG